MNRERLTEARTARRRTTDPTHRHYRGPVSRAAGRAYLMRRGALRMGKHQPPPRIAAYAKQVFST